MIPRRKLFGNPDRASVRISPDGSKLAFLAPLDGVLNVFVSRLDDPDGATPVTGDAKRGIRFFFWGSTGEHVLYIQDQDGDEDWHVYSVSLDSGEILDLTPGQKLSARIVRASHKHPHALVVATNDRVPQLHDLHRVDIRSGERTLLQQNDGGFLSMVCDDDLAVRLATRMEADGGTSFHRPDGDGGFVEVTRAGQQDMIRPAGFDENNARLYVLDSRGRDTAALTLMDLETGEQEPIFATDEADLSAVVRHPTERTLLAVSWMHARQRRHVFDAGVAADLEHLEQGLERGDLQIASADNANRQWIVTHTRDDGPVAYHHYDRDTKRARFLFDNRADLRDTALAPMHPVTITSRDDLPLVSYLTLPPSSTGASEDRTDQPLPMVLAVHGGPWTRDVWGFNSLHQMLADRGYAALSVNFRGSAGFGKAFLNAGDFEWGASMHDDLIDAVDWAVAEGIADPARIAIMGGSYGGYAALAGLTFTPETFACGVDIVGPSNLVTLLESIPPYWAPQRALFKTRVGDLETEEGRRFLKERSPLTHAGKICRPLLIAQGQNDPRVKRAESDQIVDAMKDKGIPVSYVLYPDEGHGFARPENNLSFMAIAEAFLAQHLGGQAEPVGDAFEGANLQVLAGADGIAVPNQS